MAIAAANFLWHLGSSSLFVDEVYSWADASVALGDLIDQVRANEVNPPGYFAALHEWIGRLGADSDWQMRLPSAICVIVLIPVLFDLGRRVAGESAGVAAAGFGALSPLLLDYAQQVRAYAPAMLVLALTGACALRAVDGRDRAGRWALGAGLLAALAFSMHYTTAFATAPLLALILFTRSLSGRARAAAIVPLGVVAVALFPLMYDQLESGRQAAISPYAELTARNALRILGTPWDSRITEPVMYEVAAALITTGAIVWLLTRGSASGRVIALAASAPVAASVVATLVSDDAIATRYTSISTPFALVAIGAAATSVTGVRRALAVAAVLLVAFSGVWRGHDRDARFADARAATDAIEREWRPGDAIVTPANDVTVNLPMRYYVGRQLPPGTQIVAGEDTELIEDTLARKARLWIVGREHLDPSTGLASAGYRARVIGRYRGTVPLVLTFGTPASGGATRPGLR